MVETFSPNLLGEWQGNSWQLPLQNVYDSNVKTINIPDVGKTSFWNNNPDKPDTVRLWRGEPFYDSKEDRIKDYNKRKAASLKNNSYSIRNNNYKGPMTGQWFTNNPAPAIGMGERYGYSQHFGYDRPNYLRYLDVNPKHLSRWNLRRPMDSGRVFIPPTNVINSDARGILHNIRAHDNKVFSNQFVDEFQEKKRINNQSGLVKLWNNIKNSVRSSGGAAVGASRNTSMGSNNVYSAKVKGMGSMIDDPNNHYLAMNAGGIASIML